MRADPRSVSNHKPPRLNRESHDGERQTTTGRSLLDLAALPICSIADGEMQVIKLVGELDPIGAPDIKHQLAQAQRADPLVIAIDRRELTFTRDHASSAWRARQTQPPCERGAISAAARSFACSATRRSSTEADDARPRLAV